MIRNFPPKYFLIFTDNPEKETHRNRTIAGLRIALTLLMEEYEIYVLLLQESAAIARKKSNKDEEETNDDDINFTPSELLENLISFGGTVITCKSSLAMVDMTEDELMNGVEIYTLHTALMKMNDCDKIITF